MTKKKSATRIKKKAPAKAKPKAKPKTKAKPKAGAKAKAPVGPKAKAGPKPKLPPGLTPEKFVAGAAYLGLVDDYFSHVGVIAVKLLKPLAVGDSIRVKGHTTDIIQKVDSIQIDHVATQAAAAGESVGIKIVDKARKGDALFRV